jgi:hypothetical protein
MALRKILFLRNPRRGRLEGRTADIRPFVDKSKAGTHADNSAVAERRVPVFAGTADLATPPSYSRLFALAAALPVGLMLALGSGQARAASRQDCVAAAVVLWGDGRHDDTQALNAWFHGHDAIWGDSGTPIGAVIAGRRFRLSSALLVPGGTGRILENFRLFWPRRGETVAGGEISAGRDPNRPPVVSGVAIRGGDAGEGKPFETPDPGSARRFHGANCATS